MVGFTENKQGRLKDLLELTGNIKDTKITITFDNHLMRDKDVGSSEFSAEFADIGIWINGHTLFAIEAKYTEDWDAENDIIHNLERIKALKEKQLLKDNKFVILRDFGINHVAFGLLIMDSKYKNGLKMQNSRLNNLNHKRIGSFGIPNCLFTWEQVIKALPPSSSTDSVKKYFEACKTEMKEQKRLSQQ
jgi:hypothetical protein